MTTYYASDWTGRMDQEEALHWYAVSMDLYDRETTPYDYQKISMANEWMFAGDYRYSWAAKLNAIKAVASSPNAEIEVYFNCIEENELLPDWAYSPFHKAVKLLTRLLCLVILIINRDGNTSNEECTFSWGYQPSYAGWDAWFVDFDLKNFRYYIYTDGDWNM
jgi:hypothetical protein